MSEELVKRLRDRAKEERSVQANNEAVATALMGQRLLFDQGHRSPSNTYAVRLAMDHDNCARQDAKLAADWDEAADRIDELEVSLQAVLNREAATTARYDAKTDELEDKLAKATEALRAVAQHEASIFFGLDAEKNRRASWRGVMRKAKAALAEIEGSDAP